MLGELFKSAIMLAVLCAICSGLFVVQQMRDGKIERGGALSLSVLVIAVLSLFLLLTASASARDYGQWEDTDPKTKEWYQGLMQPDNPAVSCCGEADGYWADSYDVDGDKYVAIITDPRPDAPLKRKHVDIGTRFVVPNHKLKYDQSNPTGHGIIFLSASGFIYCYVAPGGV